MSEIYNMRLCIQRFAIFRCSALYQWRVAVIYT